MKVPEIPGYRIDGELGRGARGVVYRGKRGDVTYAVKVQNDPQDRSLLFYATLACIRHPGLPEIIEVGEAAGRPYLVREFVPGYTLQAELEAGPLEEGELVEVAKMLAGGLDQVHRHGLIHRDVKPANVVVSRAGTARLIDFGFATFVHSQSAESAVGTYQYSAPEQTGMLDAPLDQRTDLYALGAVLFHCATGRPPYQAESTSELLRLHASAPIPLVRDYNPKISPALTQIIEKLLAKDPRDRYQTGQSLLADLRALTKLSQRLAEGQPVRLGETGQELRHQAQAMVGREAELEELSGALEQTMRGRGVSALIEGQGGSGKSLLSQEFLRRAQSQRPLVLEARCLQGQVPFASIRVWVEAFFARLALLPPVQRQPIESELRKFASERAGFLARLGPSAASFFGAQPEEGTGDQVFECAARFFLELARIHGSAVLVLDDAHQLDEAGHAVLRRLRLRLSEAPLMLLATARPSPGLDLYLDTAVPTTRLTLNALTRAEVELMVYALLGSRPINPELVELITERSQGNPFTVQEYVRAMLVSGAVLPSLEGWRLEPTALQQLKLSDDILELVLQRISALDESLRNWLTTAAVYGTRFALDDLAAVEGAALNLEPAVRANVIERSGPATYLFVHDRIREAFLSGLDPERERVLHRKLAVGLEPLAAKRPELSYAVARHYALGEGRSARVYETNLTAGTMALRDFAFEDAYQFLTQARQAAELGRSDWMEPLSLASERTNRVEEAIALIEQILEARPPALARAQCLHRLSKLRLSKLDRAQARVGCQQALAAMSQPVLDHPLWNVLAAGSYFTLWLLADWTGLGKKRLEGEARRRQETLAELYQSYSEGEYFEMHYPKMLEMGARACLTGHGLGPSPQLITSYANMMVFFGMLRKRELVERRARQIEALSDKLGDPVSHSHLQVMRHVALHIAGQCGAVDDGLDRTLLQKGHLTEPWVYLIGVADLAWVLMMRGYVERAWTWVQRGMERCRVTSSPAGVARDLDILACYAISCQAILGRPGEAMEQVERLQGKCSQDHLDRSLRANFYAHQLSLHLETGDLGAAMEQTGASFLGLGLNPALAPLHRRHFYVLWAYCWLERCLQQPDDLPRVDQALKLLRRTANRVVLEAHLQVALGGRNFLAGRNPAALADLARAQDMADLHDLPWVSYQAGRWRARVLAALGKSDGAAREAGRAYRLAVELGWPLRARAVAREFSMGRSASTPSGSASASVSSERTRVATSEVSRLERQLEALLSLSQGASRVLSLNEQAQSVLDELIRLLAAERSYLFVADDKGLAFVTGRDRTGETLAAPSGYSRTVIETVYFSHEPVVVAGTEQGAALGAESVVAHDLRSIICSPLMIRGRCVGVVYLDNRLARGVFTEEDTHILTALSSHIALAIESARASQLELEVQQRSTALASVSRDREALQRWVERLRRVLEGARQIAAAVDPAQLYDQLRGTLTELIAPDILLLVSTEGAVKVLLEQGRPQVSLRSGQAPGQGLPAQLEDFCRTVSQDGEALRLTRLDNPLYGMSSLLAVPIPPFLVLVMLGKRNEQFDPEHQDLVTLLAYQASAALANLGLQRQVTEASKLAAVGQVAAGVAHELNNPLGAARLAIDLASSLAEDPELVRKHLASAGPPLDRAAGMVNSLLSYARRSPTSELGEVRLNEVVSRALENPPEGVQIELRLQSDLPALRGSSQELTQVVLHLIQNATDALAEVEPSRRKLRVSTRREGEQVVLEVADSGPGFAPQAAERATEPFFTTRPMGKGTGLGLSICDRIVNQHDGKLSIGRSDLGGASVCVRLPV